MVRAAALCPLTLAALLGGSLCSCDQSDDVVAQLSAAVGGTGPAAGQGGDPGASGAAGSPPSAMPDAGVTAECQSQIPGFNRLEFIAGEERCFVPLMDSTRAFLTLFFNMEQLMSPLPGESLPFSVCAQPFPPPFYEGADNQFYLCPAECQRLRDFVAQEKAMIDACVAAMI